MSELISMTGAELRKYRKERLKMTQDELAQQLGVSRPTISSLEKRNGPVGRLYILAIVALEHVPGAVKVAWRTPNAP